MYMCQEVSDNGTFRTLPNFGTGAREWTYVIKCMCKCVFELKLTGSPQFGWLNICIHGMVVLVNFHVKCQNWSAQVIIPLWLLNTLLKFPQIAAYATKIRSKKIKTNFCSVKIDSIAELFLICDGLLCCWSFPELPHTSKNLNYEVSK